MSILDMQSLSLVICMGSCIGRLNLEVSLEGGYHVTFSLSMYEEGIRFRICGYSIIIVPRN
jgi:hypothetical protein